MKTLKKVSRVIEMTEQTKKRIMTVADNLKGKELFTEKVEAARNSLKNVESLPL